MAITALRNFSSWSTKSKFSAPRKILKFYASFYAEQTINVLFFCRDVFHVHIQNSTYRQK